MVYHIGFKGGRKSHPINLPVHESTKPLRKTIMPFKVGQIISLLTLENEGYKLEKCIDVKKNKIIKKFEHKTLVWSKKNKFTIRPYQYSNGCWIILLDFRKNNSRPYITKIKGVWE